MVRRFEVKLLSLILIAGGVVVAQSPPPRKDIPTIAKSAKGAIVTIVTANNDDPIALGSGFLVSSDGAIATNYHVIASGNVAVVKFADGTVLPVDGVLATDKVHDLAIIKIHGKTFQTLTLGNSDQIQVGEEVVAIGNPLGLELTVSNGILSGIRVTKEEGKFLQTTAPISHGSSGGPLFNMFGEVVGINTLYLEGGASLNFAIPVNDVKNLLHTQFARLQELPNEPNTDTLHPSSPKPDAPPPDNASPRDKESGVASPPHKTADSDIGDPHESALSWNDAQKPKPTLNATLVWIQDSLKEFGQVEKHTEKGAEIHATRLADFSGCQVHFIFTETVGGTQTVHAESTFDLGVIDPGKVWFPTDPRLFAAATRNGTKRIAIKTTEKTTNGINSIPEQKMEAFFAEFDSPYGNDFAKAFTHAVKMCGGKPSTVKEKQPPTYYVRSAQHGSVVIEYGGRQMLATCRETLTWLQGIDQAGESMGDSCTYMQSLVGKRIPAELMWQQNKELRYQPWLGQDTVQTADVLDIIAEGPVGSPVRRPSPRTSPEILKTLRWIQNTLEDREGNIVFAKKDGTIGTRANLLPDVNGCEVTFAHMTLVGAESKQSFHARQRVNLGGLDPTSLKVNTFVEGDVIGPANPGPDSDAVPGDDASRTVSIVTVHTTDKVPAVSETLNDRNWRSVMPLQSTDLSWELPAPYGARFTTALRRAITLCGGKSSSF
jgi:S1-C subfamily serine protease